MRPGYNGVTTFIKIRITSTMYKQTVCWTSGRCRVQRGLWEFCPIGWQPFVTSSPQLRVLQGWQKHIEDTAHVTTLRRSCLTSWKTECCKLPNVIHSNSAHGKQFELQPFVLFSFCTFLGVFLANVKITEGKCIVFVSVHNCWIWDICLFADKKKALPRSHSAYLLIIRVLRK